MRPFYVFDRWGNMVDTIAWPLEAVHSDSVEDDDTLELTLRGIVLSKGQRVVWVDRFGHWHENIVSDLSDIHSNGELYQTVTCENSITELLTDWLEEVEPQNVNPQTALSRALSGTNWSVGTVTATGTASFSWYHTDPHSAVMEIAESFDAEVQTTITVSGTKVIGRKVDILAQRGTDRGCLFAIGRNVAGVTRDVSPDSVVTALYGFGKSQTTEAGGQSRKLTFGSINGGKDYVEDLDALAKWGVPDGRGGKKHAFGQVEFSKCEDASELLALTRKKLATLNKPQVTYSADVISLAEVGLTQGDEVDTGDVIHVRDPELGERIETRALKIDRDLLDESATKITFGTREPAFTETVTEQRKTVEELNNRADTWDATSETVDTVPGKWLQQVMDRLNQEFDNAGQCYKYTSLEKGDIYSTVPLDEDGKPTKTPASAIQLCGLGFRIANKVEGGDFKWETFGTGDGFTANLINVGTLRCGDNYLNLDTGELRIALTAKVGSGNTGISDYVQNVSNTAANNAKNQAVQQADANTREYLEDYVAIGSFDSYLTMRNTFNALTHNGADKGFFIQNNKVFINADYVRTGIIESQNGQSVWDLNNGYFETASSGWSGGQYHGIHTRLAGGQYAVKMDQTDIGTISTYSQGNVHPFGIKVFTDLVLSAPGGVGVSYNATTDYGLTYTQTMRSGTISYVENVTGSGDSLTVTRRRLNVMHGMITSTSTIANATFSTPIVENATLASSVEQVGEIASGGAIPVEIVDSEETLMAVADDSRMVWQIDPDTFSLGVPVYTGEEWTMGVPTQDPVETDESVDIPTTAYVDAQAALIQTELEAVAASLGDAKLSAQLVKARNAIASGKSKQIATVAQSMSAEGANPPISLKGVNDA